MCSRECPSHARETAARSRVHSTPSHRSSAQQLPPEWQSLALRFWALIGEPIFRPDSAVLKCLIACLCCIKCRPEARSRGESWERSGVRLLWPLGGTLTSELCVCERDWRQKSLMFIFKWKKMMDNRYDSSNGSVCVCVSRVYYWQNTNVFITWTVISAHRVRRCMFAAKRLSARLSSRLSSGVLASVRVTQQTRKCCLLLFLKKSLWSGASHRTNHLRVVIATWAGLKDSASHRLPCWSLLFTFGTITQPNTSMGLYFLCPLENSFTVYQILAKLIVTQQMSPIHSQHKPKSSHSHCGVTCCKSFLLLTDRENPTQASARSKSFPLKLEGLYHFLFTWWPCHVTGSSDNHLQWWQICYC